MKMSPLVTFALFTYNQDKYVLEAIEGAFSQTYSPLEIIISDDSSTDHTFQIIEKMTKAYSGVHKVRCLRNSKNLGIAEHVNKINSMANGELIVVAAGDDISMPERTEKLVDAYIASNKKANYLFSLAQQIGLDGTQMRVVNSPGIKNSNSKLRAALSIYPVAIGATQAWTKLLARSFPPLASSVMAEDQVLGLRGLLIGPIRCVQEPLVYYRIGSGCSTKSRKFLIVKYFRSRITVMQMYRQRCIDAWHAKEYPLACIIATKALMSATILPLHPFLSLIRKAKHK